MTVSEFIAHLQKLPNDATILVSYELSGGYQFYSTPNVLDLKPVECSYTTTSKTIAMSSINNIGLSKFPEKGEKVVIIYHK